MLTWRDHLAMAAEFTVCLVLPIGGFVTGLVLYLGAILDTLK